nr:MAG TPA: hypothetical protein [Caudoviricetes sp.]
MAELTTLKRSKIHENMVDDGKMSYKAHIAKRGIDR